MKTIVTQIQWDIGSTPLTTWEKMRVKFTSWPKVKHNPHKTIVPYDQAKNKSCTAFASAGAYTYNTGKKFTNEYIQSWADPILKGKGSYIEKIAKLFAEAHWAKYLKLSLASKEAHAILSAWYALIVSTRCPQEFWSDGIDDGVINSKEYKKDLDGWHAIVLATNDRGDILINSWWDYEKKGKHNTYKIDAQDMLDDGLMRDVAIFIY